MHKLSITDKDAHMGIAPTRGIEEHKISTLQTTVLHWRAELRPSIGRWCAAKPPFVNALNCPLDQAAAVKATSGELPP